MNALIHQHGMALRLALRRLAATPLGTLASLLAIGIALALPATGQMLMSNAARLIGSSNPSSEISVFMKLDAERNATLAVESRLRSHQDVKSVTRITREQTLARMSKTEGLGDVIDALPRNPFPDALIVIPHASGAEAMEKLAAGFRSLPGVEEVQLDSAWIHRLDALLGTGRIMVHLLALLLGLGLIAVTFSTIRLQVLAHAAEIEVSRLLGATDAFMRRPFHYLGLLQGLLGGVIGWLIVLALAQMLRAPLAELAALYGMEFLLAAPGPEEVALLFGMAALLGWLGAALSVRQHLK
jgi:cell division transport system permease protein